MRVLHVSKYYEPYVGGVENICKYLVENMPDVETAVVCFNEGRRSTVDTINGHKVWRVGAQLTIARQALSTSYFKVLRRAIRDFKPDIIQFHWANPFPAAVLLSVIPKDVKLVIHWHMDIIHQKHIYPLVKPIEKALLKRADAVCVTSPTYADFSEPLQKFRYKVRVVPNAIDVSALDLRAGDLQKVDKIRKRYDNRPIVFFVGRHIPYKGLPHLIEAAHHVKSNCQIVIAGKGLLTDELKRRSEDLNNIEFVGFVDNDNLRHFLYASRVFAFPSITKNEAFGVALAEAMYVGTPAVTFTIDGSGVNWVSINNETCLEVDNGDDKAYAAAIDRLVTDNDLWERLSIAGKERSSGNFTIPSMCAAMQKVYDELV